MSMADAVQVHRRTGCRCRRFQRRLWADVRMVGRRLRRSAWLAPTGLTLVLAVKGLHPALPGWSCPLRALTGLPCPTCFLTRATASALAGRFTEAIQWHAFGPLVAVLLVLWSLLAIRRRRLLPIRIRAAGVAAMAVSLMLYWLARLVLQFGFGVQTFPAPG